jgi:hypothetical protein
MTIYALIVALGLASILFFLAVIRNLRRRRLTGAVIHGIAGLLVILVAFGVLVVSINLHSYARLTSEQPAGELQFRRLGYHQFYGEFTYPNGDSAQFAMRGDEWQVDARLLKWQAFANLLGFDSAYRLDRISGRYTNIDDERTLPRTVYSLNKPDRFDLWELVHENQAFIPWIDALYGSATFLPMADGATYEIMIAQSGLLARPLNAAARAAVGAWH